MSSVFLLDKIYIGHLKSASFVGLLVLLGVFQLRLPLKQKTSHLFLFFLHIIHKSELKTNQNPKVEESNKCFNPAFYIYTYFTNIYISIYLSQNKLIQTKPEQSG